MALPETGVKIVTKGVPEAKRQLSAYEKALGKMDKALKKASGGKSGGAASKIFKSIGDKALKSSGSLGRFSGALQKVASMAPKAAAALGAVAAAAIALTVAFKGMWSIAQRAVAVLGAAKGFGGMVAGIADATAALNNMRAATHGNISDMELMRLTNRALSGQSEEFRQVLLATGEDGTLALGKLLDGTNRLAAATGRSAEDTQRRIIDALRLQSTLRIDDFVGTVNQTEANKAYAASLGLTSSALTAEQEKAAFAYQALQQLDDVVASLGERDTIQDDLNAPMIFLQNTLDRLTTAVLPAIAPIISMVAGFFKDLGHAVNFVLVPLRAYAEYIGSVLGLLRTFAGLVKQYIMNFTLFGLALRVVGAIAPYVAAAFELLMDALAEVADTLQVILNFMKNLLGGFGDDMQNFIDNFIEGIAYNAARGGAFIIGAFAAGLLKGGKFVIDAVTAIARIVADFLQGFSPPKKGPLKNIDKGGFNVAKAWAEGFKKGFIKPVSEVASSVNKRLGNIAKLGAAAVEKRLAQLDTALQPFQDHLSIVKADFEAIAGFADPALKAINRQIDRLLQGSKVDIKRLRALDQQAERLKQLQSYEQDRIDAAEIQLSLAKARQAQERALLDIQKRRAPVEEAAAIRYGSGVAATKTKKAKTKAEKKAKGGGAEDILGERGAPGIGEAPELISSEAIDHAKEVIARGWAEGLEASGFTDAMGEFTASSAELLTEIDRIKDADPVGNIQKKFDSLGNILDSPLESLRAGFAGTMAALPILARPALGAIKTAFETTFNGLQTILETAFSTATTTIANFAVNAPLLLMPFQTFFLTAFENIKNAIAGVFGGGDVGVVSGLSIALTNFELFSTNLLASLAHSARMIQYAFNHMRNSIITFVNNAIPFSFSNLINVLDTSLVAPFRDAMNAAMQLINDILPDEIVIEWGSIQVPNIFDIQGLITGNVGYIGVDLGSTTLDLPDNPIPKWGSAAMGARGFMGQSGLALVGERGPEIVRFGQPASVFPAGLSRNILASLSGDGMALPVGSSNTSISNTTTDNRAINNTFNLNNPADANLIQREQMAFLGV